MGIFRILIADTLFGIYTKFRIDWLGRHILWHCCAAFLVGDGLDYAALDIVEKMGGDGIRLLSDAEKSKGSRCTESNIRKSIQNAVA